jgi:hypothetical protein
MLLTLTYSGPLPPAKSRGTSPMKAALRAAFHPQLKAQVEPFIPSRNWNVASTVLEGHRFVSPAHRGLHTAIDLEILLLTPLRQRAIGDTDNRLKTLVDGLTRPANPQQMKEFEGPADGGPTYCLLDDDSLVQRISIDSRRWHQPMADPRDAFVVVTARVVLSQSADMSAPVTTLLLLA